MSGDKRVAELCRVERRFGEYFRPSATQSVCPWKGTAHYYRICVDGKENADAGWYHPDPKPGARNIAGTVAFWKGV